MITLRPLHASEYPAFLDYFLPDYAAEIASSYDLPLPEAQEKAAAETARDLPQGLQSPGQHLMAILGASGLPVGTLWVQLDQTTGLAFLNDLHILPADRRRGNGAAALRALSQWLAARGATQLRLRVASGNDAAARLYAREGFHPTGINMARTLKPD